MPAEPSSAIVTGSAGTLGRALAVRLARDGWRLALADVDDPRNRETAAAVVAAGGAARCERLDVADADNWQRLHDRLRADWPRLDLLVNCAGLAGGGCVGDMPLADWRRVLDVSLMGVVYGCHTLVPWLKANPAGAHLVNIASYAAFVPFPEAAAYNTAKAGVMALTETLRVELARSRVGVTVVCPAFFASGLVTTALMHTEKQRDYMAREMHGATVSADEIAAAVVAAVERNAPYVVIPFKARYYWYLKRLFPRYFLRRVTQLYAAELENREASDGHAQS
jgi:NAD(P)-dependent dehydrogenase (short-subunit alcohol dehydrogenase family)